MEPDPGEITRILDELRTGGQEAEARLIVLVYKELRRLAASYLRKESSTHSLQPTALVHEAYLRLTGMSKIEWKSRSHFFAVSAKIMRHILVDHARSRQAQKRGDGIQRVEFNEAFLPGPVTPEEILSLHEAMSHFEKISPRQAQIIELRFFAGASNEEIAEALGISDRTVKRDIVSAMAWFYHELRPSARADIATEAHSRP